MSRARICIAQSGYFVLLSVLLYPLFFVILRLTAFGTVPRDDYARYLLWLLHEPGGVFPGSPYGYRVLSVLLGAPFYYLLPHLPLTNLPAEPSANYWQATAALACVSYLAIIAGAMIAYRLVVVRYARPPMEGLIGALFVTLAQLHSQFVAIDPLAFLLILGALYVLDELWVFAAVLAAAVLFNEKVIIVLALWIGCRFVFAGGDRPFFAKRLAIVAAALAAYVVVLGIVRLEGHSEQLDTGAYVPTFMQNVVATVTTLRGFLLNVLPCVLLVGTVWWSWATLDRSRYEIFARVDLLVVPALVVITLVLTQFYQVGRLAMHAAPLFVLPVAAAFGVWFKR